MQRKQIMMAVAVVTGLWMPTVQAEVAGHMPQPGLGDKIKGSITALDLKAQPPTLRVTSEQGKLFTLQVDPGATRVTQEGKSANLEELKVGQKVEVEQASKDGQQIAKTIKVIPAASPAAPEGASRNEPRAEPRAPAGNAP
ncbi:MAG: hypothetical protein HYZ91_03815 [Candidatus Omnitrophica bacterium]|nr:hypothetical protein [Candidatus Omnitrophota bacterium]